MAEMNQEWRKAEGFLQYHLLPHKLISSVMTPKGQMFLVFDEKKFVCYHMTFRFVDGDPTLISMIPLVEEKR